MPVVKYKPTTPARRFWQVSDFADLTTNKPYKPLTYMKKKKGGRNHHGHITGPHRGGGARQRIRIVDFKRKRYGDHAEVLTIEYDPCRTARIALIEYEDGQKSYILAPDKLKVGKKIQSGPEAEVAIGNHLPIGKIPPGSVIHNIEFRKGGGAKLVRSAGTAAVIMTKEDDFVHVKLPSGEVRKFKVDCFATVGQCSNFENNAIKIGKAGRSRWKGRRPRVRAVAMNPVDHPMGGGEGKSSGGRHPVSRNGIAAKGLKTRRKSKQSSKYIVRRRIKRRRTKK